MNDRLLRTEFDRQMQGVPAEDEHGNPTDMWIAFVAGAGALDRVLSEAQQQSPYELDRVYQSVVRECSRVVASQTQGGAN